MFESVEDGDVEDAVYVGVGAERGNGSEVYG
jgi:hypothetical protein